MVSRKIIVIDDSKVIRMKIKDMLAQNDFDIFCLISGLLLLFLAAQDLHLNTFDILVITTPQSIHFLSTVIIFRFLAEHL
jgi:PleD family two-component response regulator